MSDGELTVIIPTWNGRKLLERCLTSLRGQTAKCRILVADNGSSDGTAEMIRKRFPSVRHLPLGSNLGFSRAVNIGIREAETEFVALLNNDAEADAGWVRAGLRALNERRDFWFFASRIVDYWDRDRLDGAGDCYNRNGMPFKRGAGYPISHFEEFRPVLGASAGAAFYRRQLFDRIGLFDEGYFMYLEDVDLSLRAQWRRLRCLYLPDAVVYHMEAASDPDRPEPTRSAKVYYSRSRVFWITRNRWQLMITYQPLRHLPWLLWGWSHSCLFHLLRAGYFGAFLRGLAAGVGRTPDAFRKRRDLRSSCRLSTREICTLFRECSPSA